MKMNHDPLDGYTLSDRLLDWGLELLSAAKRAPVLDWVALVVAVLSLWAALRG